MEITRINSKQSREFLCPRWTVSFRITATLKICSVWWQVIQHWAKMLAFDFCCFSPIIQIRLCFSRFTSAFRPGPHLYLLAFTTELCVFPSHQLHTFLNLIRFFSPSYVPPDILAQFIPYNLSYKWMFVYSPQTKSATASCNFWYILVCIVKDIFFI